MARDEKRLDATRALRASSPGSTVPGDIMRLLNRAAISSRAAKLSHAAFAVAFLLAAAGSASARPLLPAEDRSVPYDGNWIADCDNFFVLNEILWAFNSHEPYFNSTLAIEEFQHTAQTGFRTNGPDLVPRRYCAARAKFNDGRVREVKYNVIESGGFAGIGNGIEWCVVGLDRNHVYSPGCAAAQP
jgi:hypothetical protein